MQSDRLSCKFISQKVAISYKSKTNLNKAE